MTDYPEDQNRFTPPKAALAEPNSPGSGLPLAGRGARLGAVMLDGVVNAIIIYGIAALMGGAAFSAMRADHGFFGAFAVMGALAPGWIVAMIIQGWMLHTWGGTLGKRALSMRIVRTDGSRAGFVRLFFGRAGFAVVLPLIPVLGYLIALADALCIFRESRQCLHDQVADTVVVNV